MSEEHNVRLVQNAGQSNSKVNQSSNSNAVAALIVSTVSVENNNLTSVILKGNVTTNGGLGVTACGFYYGTSKDDLTQKVTLTGTEGAFNVTFWA